MTSGHTLIEEAQEARRQWEFDANTKRRESILTDEERTAVFAVWRKHNGNRIASDATVSMLADAVRAGQAMGTQDQEPTATRSDAGLDIVHRHTEINHGETR